MSLIARKFYQKCLGLSFLLVITTFAFISLTFAQTTVSTGSIVGTVTDPSGAVVQHAKVSVTNADTGRVSAVQTTTSGGFTSGALQPGNYKVQVSVKGFKSVEESTIVQVGNTSTVNVKLQVGQESQIVEVQGSEIAVNTEQAEVQGVLTAAQIENLPINGRNFLDLAQLEPGVQIQDGQNFDPTKAGFSSISFGGRFGRTARIDVDGVDISDETVGTTTADIAPSAIEEFQIAQSSLDMSNDLTSSGSVNVTTKSGTNKVHGEAFGLIRDHSFAADAPGGNDYPFQREQFGGSLGGPIIKDRLFAFADGERTKQDGFAAINLTGTPFDSLSGGFSQPFRDNNLLGKLDYNFANGSKLFYRYSYFSNSLFATFGFGFSVYDTKNYTRQHVVGYDFNHGNFSNSIRYSFLKFENQIVDATLNNPSLPDCCTGLSLASGVFSVGPNLLAPQGTPQQNNQIKYDGSWSHHTHTIRYGMAYNRILGGGFANFYGVAPQVSWLANSDNINFAATGPFPGGSSNPLNYPVQDLVVGNGQGYQTSKPALGFPAGGLGPDNRIGLYIGDVWKIKPNLTMTVGLRYDRDTGRTDSDLPAIPEINAQFPGYGNPVKQANLNFAPQLGIAWDPFKSGKSVIRAGIGLYYENIIFNNVLYDRPLRLRNGAFNADTTACSNGVPQQVQIAGGTITPSGICGLNTAIGTVIPQIQSFWQQVLAGNPFDLQAANPNFIGTGLSQGLGGGTTPELLGPNYKTPRSVQMNIGIQHEIRHGMVFSADVLRNIETRTLIGIDANKVGDVSTFNLAGAKAAIAATNSEFNCPDVNCSIAAGAQMSDFAGNGLGTPVDVAGVGCSQPVSAGGLGTPCAFGGINASQAQMYFLQPEGRSVYNALQMTLKQNVENPFRGVKSANLQVSYSLSKFESSGGGQLTGTAVDSDQDFILPAADNNSPGRYFGPGLLDRRHQLSFGGFFNVPWHFRLGLMSHFYSPLSSGLIAPNSGLPGEIFRSDFTGDGTVGDPLPGTKFGAFDRSINASDLNKTIANYNQTVAGQATPAGQLLIQNGLFTLTQLQAIGGVAQPICPAPPAAVPSTCAANSTGSQVNFPWLKTTDLTLAWNHTFYERITVEPSVGFYNLFNFANFDLPPTTMSGILNGAQTGAINGTTRVDQEAFRVGNGTGVYSLGSQRQLEFGLKVTF